MNKRIKELARKARALATTKDAFGEYIVYFDTEKFEQEFAELLIKECLIQIDEAISDTTCAAGGAYKTAKIAAISRIQQHFEIKE